MPASLATASQTLIGSKVAKLAEAQLGMPYLYGGDTPKGFDCSGLVYYVYTQAGVRLPRTAEQQFDHGPQVSRKALQAGDLVFFRSDSGNLMRTLSGCHATGSMNMPSSCIP
jgi:cell wall-associated NlpC family hydrolase